MTKGKSVVETIRGLIRTQDIIGVTAVALLSAAGAMPGGFRSFILIQIAVILAGVIGGLEGARIIRQSLAHHLGECYAEGIDAVLEELERLLEKEEERIGR